MKKIVTPSKSEWSNLCVRPSIDSGELAKTVESIMNTVKTSGDKALIDYALKFDKANIYSIKVDTLEFLEAENLVPVELKKAIEYAKQNILAFHKSQVAQEEVIETAKGVFCWRESRPIEKIGLYIPGGSAPLFSTILMLGIPAKIAGCKKVILCTPPDSRGKVNPAILYTAKLVGITEVYKVGGAQAIAAMTFGTESIPSVYKIFGPGNQFVTKAKELAQLEGIAIDMPAGPSEVLIIADKTCIPEFVAADLLSQAEHGSDSQVVLLSDNNETINKTIKAVQAQLINLRRKEIAIEALKKSFAIEFDSIDQCISFSNMYAPEHLIIASKDAKTLTKQISNAGSVFIGNYSCESAGDYASGTNHTLPTNGFAKNYSGVSVDSFIKKITFQELTSEGIQNIGPYIEIMAEAEQLQAHKNAVTIRLKNLRT